MNRGLRVVLAGGLAVVVSATAFAASIGTAFTYQGHLENSGGPVTDTCDFRFGLWDAAIGMNQIGNSSQTKSAVSVVGGQFSVPDLDFGDVAIDGTARWLEIEVQCTGDAGFTLLAPRVELTPAPHALTLPGLYTEQNPTSPNLIGGYSGNVVAGGVVGATVSGGGEIGAVNQVVGSFGTIGGGKSNNATSDFSVVGGGATNSSTGNASTVGGGSNNTAAGPWSTISGGEANNATGDRSAVGGGNSNWATDLQTTVAGGGGNTAGAEAATIGGGRNNSSSGTFGTVSGGQENTVSGYGASIPGGRLNLASGDYAIAAGGVENQAGGSYSFAAGRNAKVRNASEAGDANGDEGTFVWADSDLADFQSSGPDQFLIRAAGGVGINTNDPQAALHVAGTAGVDGIMFPDGTLQTTAGGGGGGGGNTLDQAYDQGGPGAGATITADAGPVVIDGPDGLEVAGTIKSGSSITIDGVSIPQTVSSTDPIDFNVGGSRVFRLEPNANSVGLPTIFAPNVLGGLATNQIDPGVVGATISGGGSSEFSGQNIIRDDWGTIGGGAWNVAGDLAGTTFDEGYATVGGGLNNHASGRYSAIGGGGNNGATDFSSTVGGGFSNDATNSYSTVGGGFSNDATDYSSTVGGGHSNNATATYATVPGGRSNQATGGYSTVGGGRSNVASAAYATIGGGGESTPGTAATANRVTDDYGTVGGGGNNQAGDAAGTSTDRRYATVGGGDSNTATGSASAVGGGFSNDATGNYSTVSGGDSNDATGSYSTVGGGDSNDATGNFSTVGGGFSNQATGTYSSVGGGVSNAASAIYATIGGGGESIPGNAATANRVTDSYGTVGGGANNQAGDAAGTPTDRRFATVGGGSSNQATGIYSSVGGGVGNVASAAYATIGGGGESTPGTAATANRVTDDYGTVGGGGNNQAGDAAGTSTDRRYATVGGGESNDATGNYSTVGGGFSNQATGLSSTVGGGETSDATGNYSTVGGGVSNYATDTYSIVGGGSSNYATGHASTVGGGQSNDATGAWSIVPGGYFNQAGGHFSFAAGRRAKVRDAATVGDVDGDNGTFVWADSNDADFTSTGANRFLVRASGGTTFYSNSGLTTGVTLAAGGGSWASVSDKNLKENFAEIDKIALLDRLSRIPIGTWNYKSQDPSVRHVGPMAQDFYAAFGVGEEETRITTIDSDGVALAAIQGLHQMVQEKDCEISDLKSQKDQLEARVAALEAMMQQVLNAQATSGR